MTRRWSRHKGVALLVALLSCLGGMSLAVVAFAESNGATTPTQTLAGYGSTTPTMTTPPSTSTSTATSTYPSTTPTTTTGPASGQSEIGSSGSANGVTPAPSTSSGSTSAGATPSTGRLPSRLAFTGGRPIAVGLLGVGLMLGGLGLGLRRRRSARLDLR